MSDKIHKYEFYSCCIINIVLGSYIPGTLTLSTFYLHIDISPVLKTGEYTENKTSNNFKLK